MVVRKSPRLVIMSSMALMSSLSDIVAYIVVVITSNSAFVFLYCFASSSTCPPDLSTIKSQLVVLSAAALPVLEFVAGIDDMAER